MSILRISAICLTLAFLAACSESGNDSAVDVKDVTSDHSETNNSVDTLASPHIEVEPKNATVTPVVKPQTSGSAQSSEVSYDGIDFTIADISERTFNDGNALAVTFSVPVDGRENFSQHLTVKNKKSDVDGDWVLSDSGKVAYFENIEPSESYDVSVNWRIKSITGKQLSASRTKSISTRNLNPAVSFGSSGHYLPLDLHTGLPVISVNIPEVDIRFHRIQQKYLPSVLSDLNNRNKIGRYRLDRITEMSTLVHSGRYTLPIEKNKRRSYNIALNDIPALREPGLYMATLQLPDQYGNSVDTTYFMVTDLGIHAKRYKRQLDVYVNSLKSAKPVAKAAVKMINDSGLILNTLSSDENGYVSFKTIPSSARYLLVTYQDSYSILKLNKPALDLSDFDLGERPYLEQELFIYSERDLYRPGDTINFNALLRDFDGKQVRNRPLKVKLIQPNGQTVKEFSWQPQENGYYAYRYPIDKNAQVGTWSLRASGIGKAKVTYSFKVEEFLPERLKLTFNPDNKVPQVFSSRERVSIPVLGEYLYGAPAAGNRFDARLNIGLEPHPFETFENFTFGNVLETQWNDSINQQHLTTEEDGSIQISLDSSWEGTHSPLKVSVFASLYESGGRPISRSHKATILPQEAVVGIRPEFKDRADANSTVRFELLKTSNGKDLIGAGSLSIALVREERRYYWEHSPGRGWHYNYTEAEYVELSTSADIPEGKTGFVEIPVEYGRYRLEVSDPETGYLSSMRFDAGQDWYGWWRGAQSAGQSVRPDAVTVALDKAAYAAGDKIVATIVPPADGEALIVVEGNRPLWATRTSISRQGAEVTIPMDPSWNRHDLYISVVHIQKADLNAKITPTRSFGLVHLPLQREDRRLHIEMDVPEKWLPNRTVDVDLTVTNKTTGEAVKEAWVTVAAVDVGILNITDYQTPKPFEFFFGQRRYNVDALDMYNELIELNDNALARMKFGGDAGDLSRGGKKAQSEVQIVSLFSGLVSIQNGQANISLALPDFNGRLKLMAVAFSDDSFSSAEEEEVIVAAPVVTQLSLPRFVASGDSSSLAVDVTNLSGEPQTLSVNLSATEPLILKAEEQTITLQDQERTTLNYRFDTGHNGHQSVISLQVNGIEEFPISRQWKLNTRSPYPAVTVNEKQVLKPGEVYSLKKTHLENYVPASLETSITLSDSVSLDIRNQLDYLLRYPYGCLEQTTSSTYPWLYANDNILKKSSIKNTTGKSQAESVQHGIDRIMEKQKSNGSFGLWSASDRYEQHWLTVYVADFLTDARQNGFKVSDSIYNDTMGKLREYMRSSYSYGERWSAHPQHYKFAYRSYASYIAARHGKANLGHIRKLIAEKGNAKSFLPLVHLGIALNLQGDNENGLKLIAEALMSPKRDKGYLGDYGSDIRDLAMTIHLLSRHNLYPDKVPQLAIMLAESIRKRTYLSTQERNAVFLAGIALETGASGRWSADIKLADSINTISGGGSKSSYYSGEKLTDGLGITNTSAAELYASVSYSGYPTATPEPVSDRGLQIERDYFDLKGNRIVPENLNVGDLILVALKVSGEEREPDLMLVDLLPAGLELENQNLKNSARFDDVMIEGHPIDHWIRQTAVIHQEFRDDRYVAAIDTGWEKQAYVFYLARAVTPGEYKVPAPYAEDMYAPDTYAIGKSLPTMRIVDR